MTEADDNGFGPLTAVLDRSEDLHKAILRLLDDASFDDLPRGQASFGMCSVSFEHWLGLRILISESCPTSAVGLLRLQFEALARAMWLLYVASDLAVNKLTDWLSVETEQAAKNLPAVNQMLDEIGRGVGKTVPAAAYQMLTHFRDVQLKALNSFVHAGIHPLHRHEQGYPLPLIVQIVKSANGLATMAAMTLALLSGDAVIADRMRHIQPEFADCLPDLLQ